MLKMLKEKKFSRFLINALTSLGVIVLCLPVIFLAHQPDEQVSAPQTTSSVIEQPLIDGFEFTKYAAGKRIYSLNAQKLYLRDKNLGYSGLRIGLLKQAELEGVKVTFFDQEGRVVSYLNSKSATIDSKRKNISFHGAPALITQDRRVLSAQRIDWEDSQKQLLAQGSCFLGAEGKGYSAPSIKTDPALKIFQVGS